MDRQIGPPTGRLFSALFVFVASFAVYLFTLAPTVTLVDSGELILAAQSLGVAHPPGFPLYVLLGHLASLLPTGNAAVRLHLASALFAALASATMTVLVIEAMLTASNTEVKRISQATRDESHEKTIRPNTPSAKSTRVHSEPPSPLIVVPSVVAGLTFAFSRTLWSYATIAEVYTLNALLILLVFWQMIAWRRQALEMRAHHLEVSYRNLYAAAFIFGLALGVHHVTVALMLPALAALVIATVGTTFFRSKRLLYAALFAFAGASVYLYLPLAAARSPLMNWGDPRTLERFWWHITGRQYQGYFEFSPAQIVEFANFAAREFGPVWMPLALAFAVAGLVDLFRRNRPLLAFLLLVVVFDVGFCLLYEIAEDKDAYYLPAFIALTIAASFGARLFIVGWQRKLPTALAAMALLVVPLAALAGNLAINNRAQFFVAQDYVDNVLKSVGPNGLLLTTDWQVYAPSLYVREIDRRRRDAVVIDVNQLRRSWYYDYLNQAYPELMAASRVEVEAFLEDLRAWEHNPDAYAKSPALRQRINSRFYEMILSFVANKIDGADVCVTSEIALKKGGQDLELTSALIGKYRLAPRGMAFRVSKRTDATAFDEPQIGIRGLGSDSPFKGDDVVRKKIVPAYLTMTMSSGMYLASKGNHEGAVAKFKQALAIDPTFEPAEKALAKSYSELQVH